MIAIVEAYKAGLLKPKNWLPNIIAGLIVGIVALPLAMAFAIASGVTPEQGLYTAIIAGLAVGIFGGSRVQIAGPTGAFVVILASITAKYGVTGLQVATLLSGFILLLMGFIKLGNVIKFIPDPVIVGFTSGIGVIIFVSEWKDFFGLSIKLPIDAEFHVKFISLVKAFPHIDLVTTSLALLSLFLVWLTPKCLKKIPGPLVAMIVATTLQAVFQFKTVATIGSAFGGISSLLPKFHLPSLDSNDIFNLIGPAFSIALLGAIESLLSATAADGIAKTRHHSNQELIGQGLANIAAPLFGDLQQQVPLLEQQRMFKQVEIVLLHRSFIPFFNFGYLNLIPLAKYIPLCALAAILFVVAYNMSDIPYFMHIVKRAPRNDVLVLFSTFLLTIFTNLVIAVNVGVILAMLLFIRSMSQFVKIEMDDYQQLNGELLSKGLTLPKDALVYSIQGPFFFGAAEKMEHAFAITHTDPKIIIFRLKDVPFMDMTGLETFNDVVQEFHNRGVRVYICEANPKVSDKLMKVGIKRWICEHRLFDTLTAVVQRLKY